jgi:aconitate hydratase
LVASPETCAAAARGGTLVDPRALGLPPTVQGEPDAYVRTDAWILRPAKVSPAPSEAAGGRAPAAAEDAAPAAPADASGVPLGAPMRSPLRGVVLVCAGDGVRAEQILPWGARLRPFIRDVERLARHVLTPLDPGFPERARAHGGGFIVAGADFGTGVSRDPAALAPLALGVRAVLAVSFDPIYRRQLVNAGVLPLRFAVAADREDVGRGDELELPGIPEGLEEGLPLVARNLTRGTQFTVRHDLNARMIETLVVGGVLRRAIIEEPA